jgi:hypothetical protein
MPCYNCNYQYGKYYCVVCRGQAPNIMPAVGTSEAFENLGEGLGKTGHWDLLEESEFLATDMRIVE